MRSLLSLLCAVLCAASAPIAAGARPISGQPTTGLQLQQRGLPWSSHRQLQEQLPLNTRCPEGCAPGWCEGSGSSGSGYRCMQCLNTLVVLEDSGSCGCAPGSYAATELDCTSCPKGSWCGGGRYAGVGSPNTTACPPHLTTLGQRGTSATACGESAVAGAASQPPDVATDPPLPELLHSPGCVCSAIVTRSEHAWVLVDPRRSRHTLRCAVPGRHVQPRVSQAACLRAMLAWLHHQQRNRPDLALSVR
jgi:hypothetical protein